MGHDESEIERRRRLRAPEAQTVDALVAEHGVDRSRWPDDARATYDAWEAAELARKAADVDPDSSPATSAAPRAPRKSRGGR